MASKCRKFVPNIFNKSKCQTCFGAKEMHSAEALENNKASRKMSKCGYLFVAPDLDFSNPVNKGKRWQRRFFVLYDDAELTFSVDENPDTVPQGVVDMNKVTDVVDAEAYTGHPFSIAVKSPDSTYYIKGGSKEEIQWWHDILIEFPRSHKAIKPRRKTTICVSSTENGQPEGVSSKSRTSSEGSINSDLHAARDGDASSRGRPKGGDFPAYSTFRGVRSLKHKYDKTHQEGLRKSSSLHDLSAQDREMEAPAALASSRFLSRSGDRLDWASTLSSSSTSSSSSSSTLVPSGDAAARGSGSSSSGSGGGRLALLSQNRYAHNPYCTITRSHTLSLPPPRRLSPSTFLHPSTASSSSTTSSTTTTSTATAPSTSTSSSAAAGSPTRRGSFDDRNLARKKNLTATERARLHRERSASLKDFSAHLSVAQEQQQQQGEAAGGGSSHPAGPGGERRPSEGGALGGQSEDPSPSVSADETASNETDELKMARSDLSMVSRSQNLASPAVADARPTKYEDLVYMKKGWLVKQANTEKESKKHWFVLAGNSLRYYKDSKAEETGSLDGRIDLSTCSEVSEVPLTRTYGFKIKTRNGEHVLGAMTSGIRNNWMKAIRLCMDLHNPAGRKSSSVSGLQVSGLASRAQDDFELGATHASTTAAVTSSRGETAFQLVGRKESLPSKKESSRIGRRHHSDVSPGNVSKVLSIKEFSSFELDDTNSPSSAASTPSMENSERGSQSGGSEHGGETTPRMEPATSSSAQNSPRPRGTKIPKHQTSPDSSSWAQTHLPIRRFTEGGSGDAAAGSGGAVAKEPKRIAASESSKEEKDLERMRRAKSPSARVRDKTRRMQSPSRLDSGSSAGSFYRLSAAPMADGESFESEDDVDMGRDLLSQDRYTDSPRHSSFDEGSSAPASISGENRLAELLEAEQAQMESYVPVRRQLPPLHDGSVDDVRRQLKDARDMVGRQQTELDSLHSKLDMSMSKLTGTEKALSEALKELKLEKEKFLKLQGDWNRRIRGMEGQLKDTFSRLDKTRENLTAKERECWRLESEIKGNLQRSRDQEREILKLKAVEQDYRQMKARLDDREREIAALQDKMKEQALREKKLESNFNEQMEVMEQEFGRERDDMEQHLGHLKQQLCEAHQRQTSMTSSLTSNIADILHDKDELIAQLEDQLADSDRKMGDMTEELQAEVKENAELMALNDTLQEQRDMLSSKLHEMESDLAGLQEQLGRVEGEGHSLRQHVEELQQEKRLLGEQLEAERRTALSYQRERDQYQTTIRELNDKIQSLQFRLIEKFEDIDQSVGSGGTEGLDARDLLHHIIMADSELKEVNALLTDLQASFDSYMTTLQDDTRSQAEAMASLMQEVGRKCRDVQDTLKGVPLSPVPYSSASPQAAPEVRGMDFSHSVSVDESSPAPVILAEYREMKLKFDRAVAEVKKLRKEVNDVYSCYDRMEQQEKALKEQLHSMELNYKQRLEVLVSRVEALTTKVDPRRQKSLSAPTTPSADSAPSLEEIEKHIQDLDSKLTSVEKSLEEKRDPKQAVGSAAGAAASSPLSVEETRAFVSKLQEVKSQLDSTSNKLRSSQGGQGASALQSKISSCGQKIDSLTTKVEEAAKTSSATLCCDGGGCGESDEEEVEEDGGTNPCEAVAVNKCLLDMKDRILEIGEQLDALDEETDSEDEEDEEEENTIEAVRERLAGILEYIEQHLRLPQKEWKVLGLVRAQQEAAAAAPQTTQTETQVSADQQLQQYRDRLSLEAVILGEMAFLLQNMSTADSHDTFLRELNVLNSHIVTLHQQLETETRSMHMEEAKEDILTSYAALLAEKIVLEGKLTPPEEEEEEEEEGEGERVATKPTILAAEALLRSQLDSFISAGLDKSLGDMERASSHIVTKALVQGELTYALHRMREKLEAVEKRSGGGNRLEASRDFAYQEMKKRMAMVEDLVGAYKLKMVHALAVIITKDTEEMTIVEGPESLLEGICSEISTCMEKHIQSFKEKMRSAASHPEVSRKAELAVNSLRALREVVLSAIRQEHQAYNSQDHDGDDHDEVQVPFQSLDSTINNFGEILSQQAIVSAGMDYLQELYESGLEESLDSDSSLLEDKEPATDVDKSLSIFVKNLSDAIKEEAARKRQLSEELANRLGERDQGAGRGDSSEGDDPEVVVLSMPSASGLSRDLTPYPAALVREAVFQAQLAYTSHKLHLQHQQELEQLKRVYPGARRQAGAASQDSAEPEVDVQSLLVPLEEVLDTKYEDECQVLSVLQRHCSQLQEALASSANLQQVEEMVRQLEQAFAHEMSRAQERHETHLELFKQESGKVETKWEERESEREAYEGRCAELEDHIMTLQTEHDEEMDRMRQDIMTAVSAIRANEEQSETQLADQVHRLTMQLAAQRESFKTFLEGVKRESGGKLSTKIIERAEEQFSLLEQGIIPEPLPKHLDEDVTDGAEAAEVSSGPHENTHEQELEQLRREKEEALAEEVKNTKSALEAMKKAYEEDLSAEKEKYREALVTMYTDDFVNEIRRRHEYEVEKLKDEVKQLSMHYSSKCEDYKLLEMKLQQTKTDYDSHIEQLIKSNGHLEQLVNQEIEKIKEHIRNKEPSPARHAGNHTLEEELSDAQIMIRVKDAELQKLRSQVKNLENSLQRTTEEHRQTMTQHLQLMKQHGEMQTQFKKEKSELHDRIDQLLEASGSRRPIRRTPSFHARARSPSPPSCTTQKDKSEHASRDSHRKRHIAPKDLRRSKSSPSLPFVFDAKRPGTREGAGARRPSATKATKY